MTSKTLESKIRSSINEYKRGRSRAWHGSYVEFFDCTFRVSSTINGAFMYNPLNGKKAELVRNLHTAVYTTVDKQLFLDRLYSFNFL